MRKYVLSTVLTLLAAAFAAEAIPAYRGTIKYTQPDGTVITIQRHGDEFGHWATDANGRVVAMDEDGYYRPLAGVDAAAAARAASIRRSALRREKAVRVSAKSEHIAVGQKHFLVILAAFSDLDFTVDDPQTAFSNLLNQNGYSVNGGTGSARDFYYDNSHGYFEPIFDVYGPVTLPNTKAYYGGNDNSGNDKNPRLAIVHACKAVKDEVNFADYDIDNDGNVDLVFMYYAGKGEADSDDEDSIWPHQWNLSTSGTNSFSDDGVKVINYACTNEIVGYGSDAGKMCGIGTACHEFGHAMGLPDMYDTDYETNGQAAGPFDFDTMAGGSYNNDGKTPPYFNMEERIMLGWLDDSAILEFPSAGTYTLTSVDDNIAYKTPTDKDGEYFLYECRGSNGWDASLPSHGLIVYHVDKSSRYVSTGSSGSVTAASLWNDWESYNYINGNGSHPCFYIVPAADQSNLMFGYSYNSTYGYYIYYTVNDVRIPFPGSESVTTYIPKSWNGVESDLYFTDISYGSNQVTMKVHLPGLDYHTIANPGDGVYELGSEFLLELVESSSAPEVQRVTWLFDGVEVQVLPTGATAVTLTEEGVHLVEAVLTLSDGRSQTVSLEIMAI